MINPLMFQNQNFILKSKLDPNFQDHSELSNPQVDVFECDFPSTSGEEVIHGENLDGEDYFNLVGNVFRTSSGYNDIVDFFGGRRPGPIIYVIDNTFLGAPTIV